MMARKKRSPEEFRQHLADVSLMLDVARQHGFSVSWQCYLGKRGTVWAELDSRSGSLAVDRFVTVYMLDSALKTRQRGGGGDG
jgi:hypothetical protein